jgi:hypothetical protein
MPQAVLKSPFAVSIFLSGVPEHQPVSAAVEDDGSDVAGEAEADLLPLQ